MALRLYLDNDSLDRRVVRALQRTGIDVVTTSDVGYERRSDERQLEYATEQGRAIYSADVKDFTRLHKEWLVNGRSHAGIIVRFQQNMPVGEQIRRLQRICDTLEPDDAIDFLTYLETWG
jgi:predicted nuclease of predicted toxin-antitoxin system